MKKLFIIAALFVGGVSVKAQDFKPVAGSVTTEFGLNGGINSTNFDFKDGALLRFRYFSTENLAFRLGFGATIDQETQNVYGPNDEKGTIKFSDNSLNINLGVEKHFAGTDRLSPYIGADIIFGTGKEVVKGEEVNSAGLYSAGDNFEEKGPGYINLGLRGVVGADYYIAKHLFLGAEAGLGFGYRKEGKEETTVNGTTTKTPSAGSAFQLSPNVIGAVRIGFVF